jgi:hypothetical protein
MEMQIMETVLTELLEEQKLTNQINREQIEKIKVLENKVDSFTQKLESLKVMAPPVDTHPIEQIATQGFLAVAQEVAKQPKNVIKQTRLQLFPETNSDRYYKIILSWGLLFLIATYMYFLVRQWLEK